MGRWAESLCDVTRLVGKIPYLDLWEVRGGELGLGRECDAPPTHRKANSSRLLNLNLAEARILLEFLFKIRPN